jgi:hypothetical protein
MGQQSMIIVALSSLLLSISVFGIMGGWDSSSETTATLFEREQSLNITRSGVNLTVAKLRKQKTWRTGFSDLAVAGGRVSVKIESLGEDTVRIFSAGTISGFTHQSEVVAKLSSIFPNVESALTVFGDSVEFTNDGKAFKIDGRDYKLGGETLGSYAPVSGIGVQSGKIVEDVEKNLDPKLTDQIQGKGGAPSIGDFNTSNLTALQTFYKERATMILPPGKYASNVVLSTIAHPEIVYVPGDLEWAGTISGAGILVVDGALTMKGTIKWEGIVLALSGTVNVDFDGLGSPTIIGTVWVGNNTSAGVTKVKISGNPTIKYSYITLMTVLGNLGLLEVEIISYYE